MSLPPKISESFERQAHWCRELGSPFTGLVCDLLAKRLDAGSRFGARIHDWRGRPTIDALPLRAAGALNALARSGTVPELALAYPPNSQPEPDELWSGIVAALARQDSFLHDYLDSPPQTNEVARSSAILLGCVAVASLHRQPIEVLEIGASAGLNLGFDRYRYVLAGRHWGNPSSPVLLSPSWQGDKPPLDAHLSIIARAGCDIAPLDPANQSDRERLLSYIWPDQTQRLARIEAALDLAASAPWRVEKANAADWLERRLGAPQPEGRTRLLFHSIMWQYMPEDTRARIRAAIEMAGAAARTTAPFAWLRLEPDGDPDGVAITLDLWPGGQRVVLGRGDYHGQWVRWVGIAGAQSAASV